jgi:hypothetical protein
MIEQNIHLRRRRPVKILLCRWNSFSSPFPTEIIVLDVPAATQRARTWSRRERRSGLKFLQFGNFQDFSENFRKFQKIWEIPKLTLSRETQKLGSHATLERTLTRLKNNFQMRVRRFGFYLWGKKTRLRLNLGIFGNIWEYLGIYGNFWELLVIRELFPKFQKIMTTWADGVQMHAGMRAAYLAEACSTLVTPK